MNKQTEALKIAIEAMELSRKAWHEIGIYDAMYDNLVLSIQACKEALEQPAQKPVMIEDCNVARQIKEWYEKQERLGEPFEKILNDNLWELYEGETEQPAQEPVAWMRRKYDTGTNPVAVEWDYSDIQIFKHDIPLYTHPAPSWQGLSDDEIKIIQGGFCKAQYYVPDLVRAIEQALKEKNGR